MDKIINVFSVACTVLLGFYSIGYLVENGEKFNMTTVIHWGLSAIIVIYPVVNFWHSFWKAIIKIYQKDSEKTE